MTQAHKTPGNLVKVKDKCFEKEAWQFPYYDYLKGHVFEVIDTPHSGHVSIKCQTGLKDKNNPEKDLIITIHDDEIQSLSAEDKNIVKTKLKM
jgi:hypothetical protein